MKLTEAQIRQVIESSIEAHGTNSKTHRLTERQLRKAIRSHIRTGRPINEGLLDLLGGLLNGLMDGFIDGFKEAAAEAASAVKTSVGTVKQEVSAAIGADLPDIENLDPGSSDNDKLGLMIYMTGMADSAKRAAEGFLDKGVQVENPFPPADTVAPVIV